MRTSVLFFVVLLVALVLTVAGCGKKNKSANEAVQSVNGSANISIVDGQSAVSSMNLTVKTVNGQSSTTYEVGDQIIVVLKGDKLTAVINAGLINKGDTIVVIKSQQ